MFHDYFDFVLGKISYHSYSMEHILIGKIYLSHFTLKVCSLLSKPQTSSKVLAVLFEGSQVCHSYFEQLEGTCSIEGRYGVHYLDIIR